MVGHKAREERQKVRVRARMRTDAGWHDVTIGNASSHGMLLEVPLALDRRAFIEVRHRDQVIVARVMWSDGMRCGVRTQDRVDVARLRSHKAVAVRRPGEERRGPQRPPEPSQRVEASYEASRLVARAFDFAAVALLVVAGAVGLASASHGILASGLAQVSTALEGSAQR